MTDGRQSHTIQAMVLGPDLAETSRGRRFLAEIAAAAGFSDERTFDITVACSEAIANAIEHSPVKGEVQVRALLYPDRLEVEVEGPGGFQAPDRLKERGNRGLGLPLMAKLSDHLALFSGPKGQTFVSLTFYRPGAKRLEEGAVPPSFANLSEENRLLDDVLKHLPDGFYVLDDQWRFLYLNAAVLASLDLAASDLLGTVIWEAFPDFDPAARRALETAKAERSVARVTTGSEGGRWHEWTAFPVEEGIAVFSHDMTERKRAEEALVESARALSASEQRSRLLLGVANAVAEWTDLDKVLDASVRAVIDATSHGRASIGLWDPRRAGDRSGRQRGRRTHGAFFHPPREVLPCDAGGDPHRPHDRGRLRRVAGGTEAGSGLLPGTQGRARASYLPRGGHRRRPGRQPGRARAVFRRRDTVDRGYRRAGGGGDRERAAL